LYGLEAIRAGNGWEISIIGISIVFTGLIFLSIFIGQIHNLLDFWENRSKIIFFPKQERKKNTIIKLTENQKIITKQFSLLVKTMGMPFSLSKLLWLAEICGIENPYSNLCLLTKTRIILTNDEGFHLWDTERFKSLIS